MNKKLLLLVTFLIFVFSIHAGTCTSGNGTYASWAATVWNCTAPPLGGPPGCSDNIVVNGTISISADVDYSACPGPMTVTINGTLDFNTNGVRFKLPANSTVVLASGAQIIKTFPGGGSSTLISIGGSNVWTAGDGNVTGPLVYGAPLPIELVSFRAEVCENEVCLNWITASETNNDFFEIEKTTDAISFQSVGRVDGSGNSSTAINYIFKDDKPYNGTSYYRLKQNDYNGRFAYSSLASVEYANNAEFTFEVYPNPNTGNKLSISVNGETDEEILVVVMDITGKIQYSKILIKEDAQQNVFAIDPSKTLSAGIYFITASSKQSIYNKKLIVH